jgi:plastocyanin
MLLLAMLLLAAPETGKIAGKVTIAGLAPKLANLPVTRDLRICGATKPDESLVVGPGGGIRDVVVWVTDVPAAPAPQLEKGAKKPRLDQEACVFTPHLLVTQVGGVIDVVNSDPVLHNVRASAGSGNLFNYAMPIKGHTVPTRLKKEGFFRVTCDVHPWMRAWIAVLPNAAYGISKEDGTFEIAGVPAGKHRVRMWHERLGERDGEVEVAAGGSATFDMQLNPR